MMDLRKVSDEALSAKLLELVSKERNLLCMIIICVMEIARRKSYLSTHSDLFSYLTDLLKYSHGSAQRRKDAALLALEIPTILEDVKNGSLNLSQITLAQSAFRLSERLKKKASKDGEFKVPTEVRKQILAAIKDKSVADSEVIIYSMLNIKPKSRTKLTHQSDGSVRCETTYSKVQWEKIERTKELLSHSVPTGEMTDLMEYLCDRVIAFKDKTVPKQSRKQASSKANTRKENENGDGNESESGSGKGNENENGIGIENGIGKEYEQKVIKNENTALEVSINEKHKSLTPANSEILSGIRQSARIEKSEGSKSDALKRACDNRFSNFDRSDRSRECVTSSVLERLANKIRDPISNGVANTTVAEIPDGIGTGSSLKIPDGIAVCPSPTRFVKSKSRAAIPAPVQRQIFERDKCCQHVSPDGRACDSRWHLQIDHIQPVWAGGGNDVGNLRLLCGAHNRAAYRKQSGVIAG